MDNDSDWTATTLFSPSKARVQQAQAKDWAVVDAWLSKKYSSKRLPVFERNEETLQALLALANVNENADEQRSYIDRIDKTASSAYSKRATANAETYRLLMREPICAAHFNALAESAVELDCPVADVAAIGSAILDLTSRAFVLEQEILRVEAQIDILKAGQFRLLNNLEELGQNVLHPSPDSAEQCTELLRAAKHMRAKLVEYDERLTTIGPLESSDNRLETFIQKRKALNSESTKLSQLNSQLKAYRSLPANVKAAQSKVENVRGELLALVKKRDRLFDQLADPK